MKIQGIVVIKDKLQYSKNVFDSQENYVNQKLFVIDIAVDNSGYLCLNKDKTMLADIDIRDVLFFISKKDLDDIKYANIPKEFRKILNL
jgi:hypothetical protein